MTPTITLLTDFGLQDSYVAEMKGVILGVVPGAALIDVTHAVPPGDILAGQYLLGRTWHRFPRGTVHLVVIDPGVGTSRRAIAATRDGHAFVAPDNGVLTPILDGADVAEIPVPADASPTFHGRDVFAPAAARLAAGVELATLGGQVSDAVVFTPSPPGRDGRDVIGRVVHVDRFGTLVTDISTALFEGSGEVVVGGEAPITIRRTFADVEPGMLVAFPGSGGTLEIAARDRSAALQLGVGAGTVVRCRPR